MKSIILYGSECWTLSSEMEQRLEATEVWFYRRMLKIPWTERVTNEEVLRRMQTDRTLMNTIIDDQPTVSFQYVLGNYTFIETLHSFKVL